MKTSDTPEDYQIVGCLKKQLSDRFEDKFDSAIKAVKIIPNNLEQCKAEDEALVLEYYNEDLPSLSIFQQELKL